jgi:hypothetical protein
MQAVRFARPAALIAALLAAPAAFSAHNRSLDTALPAQGLQQVQIPGFGLAYGQPGALAGYDRVLLEPVDVAFRRDWTPYRTGSALPLSTADRQKLADDVARTVRDAFTQTLQRRGLRLADAAGPGVLRVRLHVVDLYLNNPWVPTPGRSRVLTNGSGEITLVGELSDAQRGDVLARVADWVDMRQTDRVLLPSNNIRTDADVQAAAAGWAASLADAIRQQHRPG